MTTEKAPDIRWEHL